jgi:hypothetical protein
LPSTYINDITTAKCVDIPNKPAKLLHIYPLP